MHGQNHIKFILDIQLREMELDLTLWCTKPAKQGRRRRRPLPSDITVAYKTDS